MKNYEIFYLLSLACAFFGTAFLTVPIACIALRVIPVLSNSGFFSFGLAGVCFYIASCVLVEIGDRTYD